MCRSLWNLEREVPSDLYVSAQLSPAIVISANCVISMLAIVGLAQQVSFLLLALIVRAMKNPANYDSGENIIGEKENRRE
jgi:hypothetical protein